MDSKIALIGEKMKEETKKGEMIWAIKEKKVSQMDSINPSYPGPLIKKGVKTKDKTPNKKNAMVID